MRCGDLVAEVAKHSIRALITTDDAVPIGPQGDQPTRVAPAGALFGSPVGDRKRPIAVDVHLVGVVVQIPVVYTGRATADLRHFQPLRPEEPLHMSCGGVDPQRGVHRRGDPPDLVIDVSFDRVGGDHLGADPSGPHRFKHVGEVVRHKAMVDVSTDSQRVDEAFMAFDPLLHRHGGAAGYPAVVQCPLKLILARRFERAGRAGCVARLDDDR